MRASSSEPVSPVTLLMALGLTRSGTEVSASWISGAFVHIARLWPLILLAKICMVMMLRLQRERMSGSFVPSVREYFHYYGLDAEKLKAAKEDALVMHPGPMNRGVEIASDVADGPQSVIESQVEMGVAVRMAVMETLLVSQNQGERV